MNEGLPCGDDFGLTPNLRDLHLEADVKKPLFKKFSFFIEV